MKQEERVPPRSPFVLRLLRPLRLLLAASLLGALCGWLLVDRLEEFAANRLRTGLGCCPVELGSVSLLRRGGVVYSGVIVRHPQLGEAQLGRVEVRPSSWRALLGSPRSWEIRVHGWAFRTRDAGPGQAPGSSPWLQAQGDGARLSSSGHEHRLQLRGELIRPGRTPFQLALRRGSGPLRVRVELTEPLDLTQVADLPARLGRLSARSFTWQGDQRRLVLRDLGFTAGEGAAGSGRLEQLELGPSPGEEGGLGLRLVGLQAETDLDAARQWLDALDLVEVASRLTSARAHLTSLLESVQDRPAAGGAPARGTPGPGRPTELRLEDSRVLLTRRGHQLKLELVQGHLQPGRSLRLQARFLGPAQSSGEVDLELDWPRREPETLLLAGQVRLSQGSFFWAPLSPRPLEHLDVRFPFSLRWEEGPARLDLALGPGELRGLSGRLELQLDGLDRERISTGRAVLELPRQPCQHLADALPGGLIGPLAGMQLQGELQGELHLAVDLTRREDKVQQLEIRGPGLKRCSVESLGEQNVEWLTTRFVHRVIPRRPGLPEVQVGPGKPDYVPLEQIPAHVLRSMLVTENASFYHGGPLSLGLLRKALELDLTAGRYVYGGSTISQQLVKNLFLTPEKHLARKLQEALIAWRMEQVITKDRILELYVNCIEFGPGVYGIEQAARFYFGHGARELTPVEGAFLATIKPLPADGPRMARNGKVDGWWYKRVVEVMEILEQEGEISPAERQSAAPFQPEFRLARHGRTADGATPPPARPLPIDPDIELVQD